jgi:hypothetical protein
MLKVLILFLSPATKSHLVTQSLQGDEKSANVRQKRKSNQGLIKGYRHLEVFCFSTVLDLHQCTVYTVHTYLYGKISRLKYYLSSWIATTHNILQVM